MRKLLAILLLFPSIALANPCVKDGYYDVGCALDKGILVLEHSTELETKNGLLVFRIRPRRSPVYQWGQQIRSLISISKIQTQLKEPVRVNLHLHRSGKLLNYTSSFAVEKLRIKIKNLDFPPAPKELVEESVKFTFTIKNS